MDTINEVLCVLANNFGKVPRVSIVNVFSELFTEDEITDAIVCLFVGFFTAQQHTRAIIVLNTYLI